MFTSIRIEGFKGFRDMQIPDLRRFNLILGGQNSGKTSFLEAIYGATRGLSNTGYPMHNGPLNFERHQLAAFITESLLRRNIGNRHSNWAISNGLIQQNVVTTILATADHRPKIPAVFPVFPIEENELVTFYDMAVRSKTKKQWVSLLRKIEPRLDSLESVSAVGENSPSVHADLGHTELMPLSMLGQGFNRLAYLYAGLLGKDANIALIDEIENGIHYSALPTLWQGIANIAEELDIQIFATTHSYECIQAAAKVFESRPGEFQLIRLERTEDNNIAPIIIRDEKLDVVLQSGWEIR
jgi:AAA15 family ATPase/GTPase